VTKDMTSNGQHATAILSLMSLFYLIMLLSLTGDRMMSGSVKYTNYKKKTAMPRFEVVLLWGNCPLGAGGISVRRAGLHARFKDGHYLM
jgi:hypothetical protein